MKIDLKIELPNNFIIKINTKEIDNSLFLCFSEMKDGEIFGNGVKVDKEDLFKFYEEIKELSIMDQVKKLEKKYLG